MKLRKLLSNKAPYVSSLLFFSIFLFLSCEKKSNPLDTAQQQPDPPPDIAWMPTQLPLLPFVNSFQIGSGNKIYASTDGGIYLSTDNGQSWSRISSGLTDRMINCVLELSDGTLLAGEGGCGGPKGVLRSSDHGATWSPSGTGLTDHCMMGFVMKNSFIFAGTGGGGIFRSTDYGNSWEPVNNGVTNKNIRCLLVASIGDIYLGSSGTAVYRSTDNGDNWLTYSTGSYYGVRSIVEASRGSILVSDYKGIVRTTDNGATWSRIDSSGSQALGKNTQGTLYGFGNNSTIRSVDDGKTWINIGTWPKDFFCFSIAPDGSLLVGMWDNGIVRSVDEGAHWATANVGIDFYLSKDIALGIDGTLFSSGLGVFRSTNRGDSWNRCYDDLNTTAIATDPNGNIYSSGVDLGIFSANEVARSTDNGNTWKTTGKAIQIYQFVFNSQGHIFGRSPLEGIVRSTDNGATWTDISTTLPSKNISSITTTGADNLFACVPSSGVYQSTDNGLSWKKISNDSTDADSYTSVAVITDNTLLVGTANGILRSINNGANWTTVYLNSGCSIQSFCSNPQGHVFAGTGIGSILRSSDSGVTWQSVSAGLASDQVTRILSDADGYLYAALGTHGIYRTVGPSVTKK
jgi:photosystem II stability/assembly factor-like uncharacterized protein